MKLNDSQFFVHRIIRRTATNITTETRMKIFTRYFLETTSYVSMIYGDEKRARLSNRDVSKQSRSTFED